MNNEVKDIFLSHTRKLNKQQLFELYKGAVPQSTLYKWYSEVNLKDNFFVNYSIKAMTDEWERLKHINRGYTASPATNKIILHHQQHFYDNERQLLRDPEIKRKLLLNRQKYLGRDATNISVREILLGFKVSGMYRGFSHFSPFWIKQFLIENNCKKVYDPTGGWGHRLLGACSLSHVHYYYNDFWRESVEGVQAIKKILNITNCDISNYRSEKFIPNFTFDTVFTCPPYYNKERYSNTIFKDVRDFIDWWANTVNCFMRPDINTIGICIDIENVDYISKPILDRGFDLKSTRALGPKRKMHYLKTNKDTRDLLLTFSRPY